MIRKRNHRLLLLAALVHLFADVAFADGAVLCVGPVGHAAIEAGHFSADCQPLPSVGIGAAVSRTEEADPEFAFRDPAGECADCTDTPLHGDAEKTSEDPSWEFDRVSASPEPFFLPMSAPDRVRLDVARSCEQAPALRAHRSVVLVI